MSNFSHSQINKPLVDIHNQCNPTFSVADGFFSLNPPLSYTPLRRSQGAIHKLLPTSSLLYSTDKTSLFYGLREKLQPGSRYMRADAIFFGRPL